MEASLPASLLYAVMYRKTQTLICVYIKGHLGVAPEPHAALVFTLRLRVASKNVYYEAKFFLSVREFAATLSKLLDVQTRDSTQLPSGECH